MNTYEQLKAQAIVNAYGGDYGEIVDENGWATYYSKFKERGGIEPFGEYDVIPLDLYTKKWRPLSLRGVENNNGWIQCDEDSTFEPNWYWVKKKDGDEEIAFYAPHRDCFGGVDADIHVSDVTHFQLINKPQPPIF